MKKNLKRSSAILLCIALAVSAFSLSGCKKEEASSGGVPTLTWYVAGETPKDIAEVMGAVNEKLEPMIGAKIDMKYIDTAAFTERLSMMMASSADFDLCFTGYLNPFIDAARKGGYLALDDLLEKHPALKESIPDYAWKCVTYQGKIYAVPNVQILSSPMAMVSNRQRAEELGFDFTECKTVEDFEPFFEVLKKERPDLYPYNEKSGVKMFNYEGDYEVLDDVALIRDKNGKWTGRPVYELEGYKKAVWKIHDWYKKGYIRKDALTATDRTQDAMAGKYGFGPATYKPGGDTTAWGSDNIYVRVTEPVITNKTGTLTNTAISRNSKNPEKAMAFLEVVNTDKWIFNTISFGIEGKHYEKTGEDTMKVLGTQETSGYWLRREWMFGSQFNAYRFDDMDEDVWQQTIDLNDNARKSEFIGFYVDTNPIRTELVQVAAIVDRYKVIQYGAQDPDEYYDEFLAELDKAGLQKVCDEYAKQINEWEKEQKKYN